MHHHSCSSSFPPSPEGVPGFAALCAVGCRMRIFKDSAEADSSACRHVSPHCNRHYRQFVRASGPRGSGPSHRSTFAELTQLLNYRAREVVAPEGVTAHKSGNFSNRNPGPQVGVHLDEKRAFCRSAPGLEATWKKDYSKSNPRGSVKSCPPFPQAYH